jgi:hypothetical protein
MQKLTANCAKLVVTTVQLAAHGLHCVTCKRLSECPDPHAAVTGKCRNMMIQLAVNQQIEAILTIGRVGVFIMT